MLSLPGCRVAIGQANAPRVLASLAQYRGYNTVENPLLIGRNTASVFSKALVFWVEIRNNNFIYGHKLADTKLAVFLFKVRFHFLDALFAYHVFK